MQVHYLTYPLKQIVSKHQVLALGYFDGLHKGHQEVLLRTKELAKKCFADPGVLTFHPHPSEILGKNPIRKYITPLEEKIRQFHRYGIDSVYIISFDFPFSQVSKEDFLEKIVLSLSIKGIVTGSNFTFGKGAAGKVEDLKKMSRNRFAVEIIELLEENGVPISSTRARKAIANGRIDEVNSVLGRVYSIKGIVVEGDRRGREMGFPTANLSLVHSFLIPCYGVYIVRVKMQVELEVMGIMNIGIRPTINQLLSVERLEVHLFDWDQSIYGEIVQVEFLHYLREEKKFSSIEALTTQIRKDVENARSWIAQFAAV